MAINRSKPLTPEEQELAGAFDNDMAQQREQFLQSPVLKAVVAHESAGTPDEQTLFGVHGIRVTLGDLKAIVDLFR